MNEKGYDAKIAELRMINSESEFVGLVRRIVDFGNRWIMKSGTVEVTYKERGPITP